MTDNKSFPIPERNIYWRDIKDKKPEIELRNSMYIYYRGGLPDSVVYWMGREVREAMRFLDKHCFYRCCREDCGIRVSKRGDDCGNHRD